MMVHRSTAGFSSQRCVSTHGRGSKRLACGWNLCAWPAQALLGTLIALLICASAVGQESHRLSDAISEGEVGLELRYRFEWVDEAGFDENAEASTLRTRLNFLTADWRGFQALVEFDDVREIGFDNFNGGAGTTPGRTRFPVVADPEDTRVNQAWLSYRPNAELTIKIGRQRIKLDEDRFIGNVGWRQNEQTYDAARADWKGDRWQVLYTYVDQVNRIFGNDVAAGEHDHGTHLFELRYALNAAQQFSAYLYEIDNQDVPFSSNRTVGLRYTGEYEPADRPAANWLLEWAHQVDTADNPNRYSAHYLHVQAQLDLNPGFAPKLGLELLGSDESAASAFQTPLATLHAFNGWADRFLSTPEPGLLDAYAGFSGQHERYRWSVLGHHFSAESTNQTYGWEIDTSLSIRFNPQIELLLKAARFESKAADFRSVTKFWTLLSFTL